MNKLNLEIAYFLGIGGIGMSAIARYFNASGIRVVGYDRTETALCKELEQEGIAIHYEDDPALMPSDIWDFPQEKVMFILTPAIPKDHKEYGLILSRGYRIYKRAEVLGHITRNSYSLAVAGTHGKTTTSTLLAHLLVHSGRSCVAFLGGISSNYNSNYLNENGSGDPFVVVEADEYDRSFLQLSPDIAIITSTDADHLDIYGQHDSLLDSFNAFASLVHEDGLLVLKKGLNVAKGKAETRHYSIKDTADVFASNIKILEGYYHFDLNSEKGSWKDIKLGVAGRHNVENAVAASAVAIRSGLSENEIRAGLLAFRGVKRRFEYIIRSSERVFIDDYAHHPEELRAFISSVKELYPGEKISGIFQPHLYSRTRDFADGFAESLDLLDECFLLDIYPARELPIEGVNSAMIRKRMKNPRCAILTKEQLIQEIADKKLKLLLTMGAGDIDQLVLPIKEVLL